MTMRQLLRPLAELCESHGSGHTTTGGHCVDKIVNKATVAIACFFWTKRTDRNSISYRNDVAGGGFGPLMQVHRRARFETQLIVRVLEFYFAYSC